MILRRQTLATLSIALCLICAMAGIARADFRITNDSFDSTYPGVGVGPDKLARIVWVDNSTGVYQVYWAVFDALGNRLQGPIRISQTTAACSYARVGVDNQNRSFLIWKMSGHIHFARIAANGTIEVAPKQISSGGQSCETPDLAVSTTGTSYVVYRQLSGVIHTMQYRVLDANGTVACSVAPGNFDIAGVDKYPSVAVDPGGNAHIFWNDINNWSDGLYYASYSASCGVIENPERIISSGTITRSTVCTIGSSYWMLYQDRGSGINHIYSAPGTMVSPLPGPSENPRMAGADGFPIYAVWQDKAGGTYKIMAREWDDTGYLFPGALQISDGTTGDATLPDIDTDNNGQYYVVWRDTRNGTAEIYMDAVKASGIRVTAQVHAEHDNDDYMTPQPPLPGVTVTLTADGQEWPPVVTDSNGMADFAVEWDTGAQYKLELRGPCYDLHVQYADGTEASPPSITKNADAAHRVWHIEWPHGPALHEGVALQTAYYLEKYRREYWLRQLNYTWNLPMRLHKSDNRMDVVISNRDDALGRELTSKGGAKPIDYCKTLAFLRHRSEEADIVYHEFGHSVIADLFVKNHHAAISDDQRVTLGQEELPERHDEGDAMDEAFPDYFAASFTHDPSMARCAGMTYPYNALLCIQLRNIDPFFPKKYVSNYNYDRYEGSKILSGALWDLRELIEGEGALQASVTDNLIFTALDSMIQNKKEPNPVYTFNDFYTTIKEIDTQINGGEHLAQIDEAFARHNLTDTSPPLFAIGWPDDSAIVDIVKAEATILIKWLALPGAASYKLMGKLIDWIDYGNDGLPSIGEYVELASGITDTSFVFQSDPQYSYVFSVVAVDSTEQEGFMSLPVTVDYETAVDKNDSPQPKPGESAGHILFASPNPFNPRTSIQFEMRWADDVAVSIFDVNGGLVRDFAARRFEAGRHAISWDGKNDGGNTAASGVYFAMFRGTNWKESTKLLLLR